MHWPAIARAQDGVITAAQLDSARQSANAITRHVASGELTRLSRGVYLAGGAPLTRRAQLWAGVLATNGVLCLCTAAEIWGVLDEVDGCVHVVVASERRVVAPNGVVVHRRTLPAGVTCQRTGLPVTGRAWTVLDLLSALPLKRASMLADRAVQRRWILPADIARRVDRFPNLAGNAQLRVLATRVGDGAAAESERVLHGLLRRAGISGWTANHEVWVEGRLVAVVDVAFVRLRLAIEIDGMAFHVDADRFQRDRSRQNHLVALGWTVLRFTWADLHDRPTSVIAQIRERCSRSA